MSKTLKDWLIVVLLLVSIGSTIYLSLTAHRALARIDTTLVEAERTAKLVADYSELQIASLKSPKNQKAIDATIQTAAVFNGTGRLINTQVIPRIMDTLDSLDKTTIELQGAVKSANALISNADREINANLLPSLSETAKTLGVSIASVSKGIQTITDKSGMTIDEINSLISDPQWLGILKNIETTTAHINTIAVNMRNASDQMPSIAASVEKIAKTSSKYQKLLLFAQLLATIARVF